jgi:hypothetical protein
MSGQLKIEKQEGPVMNDPKPQNIKPQNTRSQNTKPENIKPEDAESQGSRTPAMAGLAIAVVLLVVGLWLARELTAASKMQDCLMSGRTNCNVIQPQ